MGPGEGNTPPPEPAPRVTIAHDNLWWYGGAERIAATIARALPEAPFWAVLGRRDVAERMGVADRVHFLLRERRAVLSNYRRMAPLYPALIRARPLPEADLLLTSSFAFAHHFRTNNAAPQLCYCYSPLRFAWSMTADYEVELGVAARLAGIAAAGFRSVDRRAAKRVTRYIAESNFVAGQIKEFYGRDADVIYPPVDCERFVPAPDPEIGDYFLFCGRLVEAYKRPSLVVEAFRELPGERLVIAGDGPARAELERIAPANVEFRGRLGDDELIPLMQRCKASIFPSRDDFGLIPVEVAACGRPTLAYAAGGALETVAEGLSGEFFPEQTVRAVIDAVRAFDPADYEGPTIRAHAERWSAPRFEEEIVAAVRETAAG
jgi:glycosyltransferase involved in cell wall biosynthesis